MSSDRLRSDEKIEKIKYEARRLEEKAFKIEELSKFQRNPLVGGMGQMDGNQ